MKIQQEKQIFIEYFNKLIKLLADFPQVNRQIDFLKERLFINILKKMSFLENMIFNSDKIKYYLDKDISEFNIDSIEKAIEGFSVLKLLFRLISRKEYILRLLRFSLLGEDKINSYPNIKLAKGVQGPWSRLDLPLKERVWEWRDIEEEMMGKRRDFQRQKRYRNGFLNYNQPGVGEGHYWRELRTEPYLWSDRFNDSPYQQLKPGTWR